MSPSFSSAASPAGSSIFNTPSRAALPDPMELAPAALVAAMASPGAAGAAAGEGDAAAGEASSGSVGGGGGRKFLEGQRAEGEGKGAAATAVVEGKEAGPIRVPANFLAQARLGKPLVLSHTEGLEGMPPGTWCEVGGETFNVRAVGYAKHSKKENSLPSLYDVAGIEAVFCEKKLSNIGRFCAQLAELSPPISQGPNRPPFPTVFVVNYQMPGYSPPNPVWGTKKEDGEGYSLVFYLTMTSSVRKEFEDAINAELAAEARGEPMPPPTASPSKGAAAIPVPFASRRLQSGALRLLKRLIESEPKDESRQRFKAIARVVNVAEAQLGGTVKSLVSSYNGKPFMIQKTAVFVKGPGYFELDVDVHRFSYLARLGLSGIKSKLKTVIFDNAFVLQGATDDELPERILAAARLGRLDLPGSADVPDS